MAWALARDREGALKAIPLQSDEALAFGIGRERLARELHVVSGKDVRTGADAVAAVLGRLPGWRWAGLIIRLPMLRVIARAGYRRIAGRRGSNAGS